MNGTSRSASSTPGRAPATTTDVTSTFAVHADRLDVVVAAEMAGLDRSTVLDTVERLDTAVAAIDGHGFTPTPFGPQRSEEHTSELQSQD